MCFHPKLAAHDSGILPAPFPLGRQTWTGPRPLNILPPILSPCSLKISRHHGNFSTCGPPDIQLYRSVEVAGKPQNKPEGPGPVAPPPPPPPPTPPPPPPPPLPPPPSPPPPHSPLS